MSLNLINIAEGLTHLQEQAADIHINPSNYGVTREIISKGEEVKGKKNDYTSRVDQVVEARIKPALLNLVPNSGFLGEETASSGMGNRYRWIVDPTDGTAIYSLGGEYYSNSTSLIDREANNGNGAVVLGSVYQSAIGKQFLMVGNELVVREKIFTPKGISTIERIPKPSRSECFPEFMGCSFGTSAHLNKNPALQERLKKVFEKQEVSFDRSYPTINAKPASGSSALFCSDIADGKRHFALLFFQKAWDLAVGAVYAQKAGCPVVMFDNSGNATSENLETTIAQCDMKTLTSVGVFANESVKDYILEKFNK